MCHAEGKRLPLWVLLREDAASDTAILSATTDKNTAIPV